MEPEIEKALRLLGDVAQLTNDLAEQLIQMAVSGYVYLPDSDEELFGAAAIAAASRIIAKAHPPATADGGRGVFMMPGAIAVEGSVASLKQLIERTNNARLVFAEYYSWLNKAPGFVEKANKAMVAEYKASYMLLPGVTKGVGLSIKQLTRQIVYMEDVERLSFYAEKQVKVQKLSYEKLQSLITGYNEETEAYFRSLMANIPIENLRIRYESKTRYRVNVQSGGWGNIAVSLPVIVGGEIPEVRSVSQAKGDHISRADRGNYKPIISELNLYEKC